MEKNGISNGICGNPAVEASIWQLTVSERKNAATLIHYTTVRPFIFMGSSFKCFFCKEYYEVKTLLEHTPTHKVENREEIFKKYVTKGKRTIQADTSKLKCRLCEQNYPDLNTIREHLISRHETQFFAASNGMTEYKLELVNNKFVCHICDEDFHSFSLLNSHVNRHVGKVICENCGARFINQFLLAKHKESHLTILFNCEQCDKKFFKKSQLKYHTEIVHKGKERVKAKKCPKCPQTYKEHYSKMMHLKKAHGIVKNFPCHICKNIFTTRRAVTQHVTSFHTEKYKCEVCSKCFTIESVLKQHMCGHTGEKNYICLICKNAYIHKTSLRKHMKCHGYGV